MKAWIMPHPPLSRPDGHQTRARVAQAALPGLQVVDAIPDTAIWDTVIYDTWPTSQSKHHVAAFQAQGARLISIARALNAPAPDQPTWDLALQPGPYERQRGQVIGPLVDIRPSTIPTVDVLVVVSERASNPWWAHVIEELRAMNVDFKVLSWEPILDEVVVSGYGPDWICQANLVIGGAGTGTLYETLWAGKPLIAKAFNVEQMTRRFAAVDAGEAVTAADWSVRRMVAAARDQQPLGLRQNGAAELVALL